jgi:8-oxo-dGTP diphosphatase
MVDRFRVIPAVYVVVRRNQEVLLLLRSHTGYMDGHWAVPAGHVEQFETVHAAACREAGEEVGVEIAEADLVALTAMHRTHPEHRSIDERIDVFFECRRWTGEPYLAEPAKAADLGWFPLDRLPEPVVPHERYVLEELAADRLSAVTTFGFPPRAAARDGLFRPPPGRAVGSGG